MSPNPSWTCSSRLEFCSGLSCSCCGLSFSSHLFYFKLESLVLFDFWLIVVVISVCLLSQSAACVPAAPPPCWTVVSGSSGSPSDPGFCMFSHSSLQSRELPALSSLILYFTPSVLYPDSASWFIGLMFFLSVAEQLLIVSNESN